MLHRKTYTQEEIAALLRAHDINPTSQRVEIAWVLFSRGEHLSAEDVFALVNGEFARVSKATVYNALGLFAERGLIREVIADPARVFYDPNTAPHHHFYDTSTGKLMDIPAEDVQIHGLPALPEGMHMEGVDVIVRMRPSVQVTH
ncbi:MAG TPA: Fur family transcriptional regulator [Acidiferrobacterales bacterium]|nr:Fur family transcriptional regulator [Acidiferrobacterales bacterium]